MMSAVVFQAAGLLLSYPDEELLAQLPMIEDAVDAFISDWKEVHGTTTLP